MLNKILLSLDDFVTLLDFMRDFCQCTYKNILYIQNTCFCALSGDYPRIHVHHIHHRPIILSHV
ncbi:uncharacterized protein LACBIDRAFT_296613 [Laccaria bicolor S238N-H82]|uniref:Predicted protein n=1 Tax=Laccaria bicolor (strain S238N-H82 / ATCC MYA-4686) TaxID=486041 RepID=B0D991_LACBS|nr:uncharacterized protein LACBIDRAFT_296613 [Laccaria bicolor S238N-H82]EDR08973.1 predicted protein [Laccaria bicolor S238N-H82]|eukprot:XP_001880286.1 predicted protein [Laccaria bicolor S238N-H82]